MMTFHVTCRLLALSGLFAIGAGLGAAQPIRTARKPARRPQEERKFVYADITLSRYREIRGNFIKEIIVEGPDTTVDAVDAKSGGRTRLNARRFIVTLGKNRTVEKIEAVGGVKFSGERPMAKGSGAQVFNGSGSDGTYFKQEGRLALRGPVQYYVEQPTSDGGGKQWARGTAEEAGYDENKRQLILSGSVQAKVFDPTSMDAGKPADIDADAVTLDFSGDSVTFRLNNHTPQGGKVRLQTKEQKPKEKREN